MTVPEKAIAAPAAVAMRGVQSTVVIMPDRIEMIARMERARTHDIRTASCERLRGQTDIAP